MRRIAIVLTALAIVACGNVSASPPQPTATAPSTTWVTPTTDGPRLPTTSTTIQATTSTTEAPGSSTTTQPTQAPEARSIVVAPYFFIDEAGHPNRTGPFVVPVAREVAHTRAVARAAIEQLLAGPTKAERDGVPSLSSAIPPGVRLLGLAISEDIATIDLSKEFGATEDSATVAQRAAQVVFTLSRFDSVAEVLFMQEGAPVAIQIGDGDLVSRPVGIWDYLEFAAAISVETPIYGGVAENPLRVLGFGAVFEATFHYALTDADGLIIAEGMAMTNNGTGWGGFEFTIPYSVDEAQVGALIVWTYSAENGEQIDVREYPVKLVP